MKTIRLLIFVAAISVAAIVSNGCKSTPQKTAYTIERSAAITVEAAMSAWDAYIVRFGATMQQEIMVKNAFGQYQYCQLLLLDAAIALAENRDAPDAQAKITAAAANASAALADLIALVRQFGVKI